MDLNVKHNKDAHKYSAHVQGDEAVVTYLEEGEAVVFTHTVVPESLRGQGVGEELVRQAVADVRRQGREVVASCPFVQHYLEKHPQKDQTPEEASAGR